MWNKLKAFLWQQRGVWITTPSITVLIVLLRFAGLLQPWEWAVFDAYMRSRPQESRDDRVVIVGIEEADLNNLETTIISDAVLAELLEKLKAMKPRAIGLDIYRNLPEPPGSEQLAQVFETTPNLIGIQKVEGEIGRQTVDPPPILKEKGQVGANDLIADADSRVRRGLIYLEANGEQVFSLSFYLALHYLDAEGVTVEPIEGDPFSWQLGKTLFTRFDSNHGGYIRANNQGYQLLINYRGPSRSFETVSLTDILEDRVSPDWGRDRVILIGQVGESSKDVFFTPYSSGLISLPELTAGVEIHANLTSQVISAALEGRPMIQTWPESIEWGWIFLWSGIGATLTWQWRRAGSVKAVSWQSKGSPLLAVAVLLGSTYVAFLQGWWIPVIPPLVAFGGSAIAIIGYLARSAGDIRKTFGRYLTDEVVATLLENPEGLKLGGERRKITILTSDLRGFTATSERLPAEEVVKILNLYLGYMADVITSYQGTIDEFMGDGILVLFGAPTTRKDDPERAIACAAAMQLAMIPVNQKMKELGLPALQMGIGINTGEVVVGNIGSEKRTKYGVVGNQVNLTYRIESYTTGGQIIISESTLKEAGNIVQIDREKQVTPKGVKEPITIYEISGIAGKYNLFLPKEEEFFFPLETPLHLQYSTIDGKDVTNIYHQAYIEELSDKGAKLRCDSRDSESQAIPPALSNLKLNFLDLSYPTQKSDDIYVKVTEKNASNGCFYIRFTAMPPDVETRLNTLYQAVKT